MNDIFIRLFSLSTKIMGMTILDNDANYNVYINSQLNYELQQEVLKHELIHIGKNHFYNGTIAIDTAEKEAKNK